ncbi:hypothetical protein btf_226 [Dehalococcoides mccartyi BTF08]|nr:hypothetical protein [Dehalococcoides mccartyi]AGG07335.1 hypothetical protein btf_226 [Dehalococcoides mccartyi BTF08]
MTNIQSMMLAVCFGAVVGTFIGNAICIVKFAIDERREKKRIRKDNEEKQ